MEKAALLCITYNNYKQLLACIKSIYQNTEFPYHLYIIDNHSTDDTLGLYGMDLPNTTLIRNNENLWWGGGINQGIKLTNDFDYVVFLNDDIELPKNWLKHHIEALQDKRIGVVGPMNSSQRDWQSYDKCRKNFFKDNQTLPELKDVDRLDLERMNKEIEKLKLSHLIVRGMMAFFCAAFRRDTIDKVGLLDEKFCMGGDDDDYARRLDIHKLQLCLLLNTYVIHHAGASINKLDYDPIREANIKRLKKKYPDFYGRN